MRSCTSFRVSLLSLLLVVTATAPAACVADAGETSGEEREDVSSAAEAATAAQVVIYEHASWGGNAQALGPGSYDVGALTVGNDAVSSLRVPAGWRVTLYEHGGFSGRTRAFTADSSWVGDDFNDVTSGVLVEAPPYGATISITARADQSFVCAESGGGSWLIANRGAVGPWEKFQVVDLGNGNVALQALANGQYVCAENAGASPLIANRGAVGPWETFHWQTVAVQPPSCPAGQTLLDGSTCVTLTPWNGSALPDGARIAMRAGTRFKNDGCSGCTGVESFGPAWVNLTSYQWNSANPLYDYLDASGSGLTSDAIFTLKDVPRGQGEYLSGNNPWVYQKLLLQGSTGAFLGIDSTGALAAKEPSQSDAPIWVLDLTRGTSAGLYWIGYRYSMNSSLAYNQPRTYGAHFTSVNGLTMYDVGSAGFSAASFFELFIVQ